MNNNDAVNLINVINALQTNPNTKQQLINLIPPLQPQSFQNATAPQNQLNNVQYHSISIQPTNRVSNQFNQFNIFQYNHSDLAQQQHVQLQGNAVQRNCPSMEHCLSVQRIIKLEIFHTKYANLLQINQYIAKCKEFNDLNNDYKHFTTFHLSNDDKRKFNQIFKEYEIIYDFINNCNKNKNKSLSDNELQFFSKTMDKIYNAMSDKSQLTKFYNNKNNTNPKNNYKPIKKEIIDLVSCDEVNPKPIIFPIQNTINTPNNTNNKTSKICTENLKIPRYRPNNLNVNKKVTQHPAMCREARFECGECGKKYKHLCNLKSHEKIHSDEALICPYCHKRFGRKANFDEHLRIHTGETPYQCSYCFRKFKHHHSWKDHIRIHTGENPYGCHICNKKFKVGHNLTVHLRIHTGEKPYTCKICYKQFRQKSGLNSHIKRIHK